MIFSALDQDFVYSNEYGGVAPVVASFVSLCTVVVVCSWCYKCWKGSEEKTDELSTSSESLTSSTPLQSSTKYRATIRKYQPVSSSYDAYDSSPDLDSPAFNRKSIKFKTPPSHSFEIKAPQPHVTDIELPPEPPPPPDSSKDQLGCIFFSLHYNSEDMVLTLRIQKAVSLPAKDFSGTSDPFVKIMLLPDKKHKLETRIRRKNLNPVWNEVFTFEGFPHNKLMNRTLYMQVLDYDRFSRNDPIGEVEIPLSELELGMITLNLARNLQPCKKSRVPLGDLLVSLMYQPTANRIIVVVMKANRIKAMDLTGSSDPYVKIHTLHKEKRIDKKKTTIKKRTRDPVWNESFIFSVPLDKIRDISFAFSVMDYDRITQNELIGQVILGYRTTGSSLQHWTEMMNNPRKPIAKWHRLQIY